MIIIFHYSDLFFGQNCNAFAKKCNTFAKNDVANSSQNCNAFSKNYIAYIMIITYIKLPIFSLNVVTHLRKNVTHLRKNVTHLRKNVTHLRSFEPLNYPIFRALFELFTCTKYNKYKEIIINTLCTQKNLKTKIIKSKKIFIGDF